MLRNITLEDIVNYNVNVGECFFDQNESILNDNVMLGFLIAKRPDLSVELLRYVNSQKFGFGILDIIQFFEDEYPKIIEVYGIRNYEGYIKFAEYFVELINCTESARKRVINALENNDD